MLHVSDGNLPGGHANVR